MPSVYDIDQNQRRYSYNDKFYIFFVFDLQ